MRYNYNGLADTDIRFSSVIINDHEYQVPVEVGAALDEYKSALFDEKAAHQKTIQGYEELNAEKYEDIADKIMLALSESVNRDSLLAHSIDYYEKVDPISCDPIFEFRHELVRRIIMALKGLTPEGEPYRKGSFKF